MLAQPMPPPKTAQAEFSAKGSSFYAAMRIMPARERAAMYEIYHFCRAIDDIADDEKGPAEDRLAALAQWRKDIELLYEGNPPQALRGLSDAVSAFSLRREDFLAVIDGMEMDVRQPIQAPDAATLALYCDRVACAVGRLSVRVFGLVDKDGLEIAHHLGMALQLTNILRDIDEDGEMGRLYLPRELLTDAGITSRIPAEVLANPALGGACLRLAWQAQTHFEEADRLMSHHEHKQMRTPRVMSQAYHALHAALVERGFAHPRRKVRLNKARLGVILVKNVFF